MATIGEHATPHPLAVLTTTRFDEAARLMAEFGIGDVIVTDPSSGGVVGMLTDRDITVRLVARDLSPAGTEVGGISTNEPSTVAATEEVTAAVAVMRRDSIRRLPVVDDDGKPVGIVSIEDLAACDDVADDVLRDMLRALASAYRHNRISPPRRH